MLNELLQKTEPNKKEEISKYEYLINNFKNQNDNNSLNKIYLEIFNNIIEKRLQLILERQPDYLYIWKSLQAARVLSRNKQIQSEMYKEDHISKYQLTLSKLTNIQFKSKLIENILIELLTIIQRYFYSEANVDNSLKEKFKNLITDSDIIDNMILLLSQENDILLKLLKSLFKTILPKKNVIEKFSESMTIKYLLNIIFNKKNDRPFTVSSTNSNMTKTNNSNSAQGLVDGTILDIFVMLIKEEDFLQRFILLKGYMYIFNVIKSNKDCDVNKENIIKLLYIIQIVVKRINDNSKLVDSNSFSELFQFLLSHKIIEEDIKTGRFILNTFSNFAMNNELTVIIKQKWSEILLKLLLFYTKKIRELNNDSSNKKINEIIINQSIITRILRQIYSFERNRNFFARILPENIFELFINVNNSNYKSNQSYGEIFITNFNNLPMDTLEEISKKIEINFIEDDENKEEIGGYQILEMIGKGGFGSVYKVENIKDKKVYAMKMVKLEQKQINFYLKHPDEMYKAINEIRIWKKFDHPNIINYNNGFIWKGNCYIIMELVEGLSLGEYITYLKENNISMKSDIIMKILLQIVNGLRHMQKSAKVIFRDLNPNNIMLDDKFNVKLIDFGLTIESNDSKENLKLSSLMNQSVQPVFEGSVLYSSPEVMENDIITYESDIWALGCILYEMIKLRPPFCGDNPLTIAKNVCEGNYEHLSIKDFDNEIIIDLVEKCLVVDWNQRANIDDVCRLLGPFLFDYVTECKSKEIMFQQDIMDLI